jgi:hypothetical protein
MDELGKLDSLPRSFVEASQAEPPTGGVGMSSVRGDVSYAEKSDRRACKEY